MLSRFPFLLSHADQIIITSPVKEVLECINLETAVLLKVPNSGKDIGGKLTSLSYYLHFCKKSDYLILLHDKKSPQAIMGDYWADELYKLFEDGSIGSLLNYLQTNPEIGLVGSSMFVKNEYSKPTGQFQTTNNEIISKLLQRYDLKLRDYSYVAGTMFIVRSKIYEGFFLKHEPLEIRRELEQGNVMDLFAGTYTHSWERMFSFLVTANGFKVIGK